MIYPARALEQSKLHPHRALLNSEQVHRIYLDELGDVRSLLLVEHANHDLAFPQLELARQREVEGYISTNSLVCLAMLE